MSHKPNRMRLAAEALREALKNEQRLTAERKELCDRRDKLHVLANAEREAETSLEKVTADDAAALTAWINAGAVGDAPQPDQKRRTAAAVKLADARHQAITAKSALSALNGDIEAKSQELQMVASSLPGFRAQAIDEAIRPIAERLRERAEAAFYDEALILAAGDFVQAFDFKAGIAIRNLTRIPNDKQNQQNFITKRDALAFIRNIGRRPEMFADENILIEELFDEFINRDSLDTAA